MAGALFYLGARSGGQLPREAEISPQPAPPTPVVGKAPVGRTECTKELGTAGAATPLRWLTVGHTGPVFQHNCAAMARGGMNNAMTERLPALCGANKASLAGKRKRLDAVERARAAGFLRLPDFCRRISCSCVLYLGRCGTGDDRLGPCSSTATRGFSAQFRVAILKRYRPNNSVSE